MGNVTMDQRVISQDGSVSPSNTPGSGLSAVAINTDDFNFLTTDAGVEDDRDGRVLDDEAADLGIRGGDARVAEERGHGALGGRIDDGGAIADGEDRTAPPAHRPAVAPAPARAGYYLQLGAFKSGAGAESFLAHLKDEFGDSGQPLGSRTQDGITRVHAGPYASAEEARAASDKLKAKLGFKPLLRQYKD